MPTGATITEIAARAAEAPERFRVTVTPSGLLPWVLTYHQSSFEDM